MDTEQAPERRIVTLPANGFWEPCFPEFAYEGTRTAEFYVFPSRYVVDGVYPDHDTITHHGKWWDEEGAKRFARSLANGEHPRAVVREVPLYWYQPAFGKVEV